MQWPEAHWNSSAPQSRSTAPSAPPSPDCWHPVSSDMSEQSGSPSHRHSAGKQAPLPHRCCDGGHVRVSKTEQSRSSAPPSQSGSPSHTQTCGMQLPLLGHRNELAVQFRLASITSKQKGQHHQQEIMPFPAALVTMSGLCTVWGRDDYCLACPAHRLCSSPVSLVVEHNATDLIRY